RQHYLHELAKVSRDCPYDTSDFSHEFAVKEVLEWFMSEVVQQTTGKTIVREFAETRENDLEPGLKQKLLQLEEMHRGEFEIVANDDSHVILADLSGGERYNVKLFEEDRALYTAGRVIRGRIHPWGDVYRFAGIVLVSKTDEELARGMDLATSGFMESLMKRYTTGMIKDAESITINPKSTIASVLNKYPARWVDGACVALGISVKGKKNDKVKKIQELLTSDAIHGILEQLPPRSIEALKFVEEKGGWVKYSQLTARFDDEMDYSWVEHPPDSAIGILRLHALLLVGKIGIGGRMYKIAVVPSLLRYAIKQF
ncbi:MAG: hypothetical protein U9R10_00645, partial [Euryarchaeota archaeon]|nr:hypothetical protein [Euryarchaeota archaeon]